MKLRQKLAVALASAMVITSVPVVTMAASTNTLVKETIKVAKDTDFGTIATANAVRIDFKDNTGGKEVFYLELDNAEWSKELFANAKTEDNGAPAFTKLTDKIYTYNVNDDNAVARVTYEFQDETTLKVTVLGNKIKKINFPIIAETQKGDAKVSVVSKGGETTVSPSTFVFATTNDGQAIATAKATDLPTVFNGGAIADIMLTESIQNAFTNFDNNGERIIEITLDNDDFKFVNEGTPEFLYGFDSTNHTSAVELTIDPDDKQTLRVTLKGDSNGKFSGNGIGQIKIKGIEVEPTVKTPATGDLTVTVDGDAMESATTLTVAKVSDSGCEIEIKEKDKVDVKAGEQKEVKLTVKETEKDAFINGREIEFTLDKGYFMDQVEDAKGKYSEEKTIEELNKKGLVTVRNTKLAGTSNEQKLEITGLTINDDDQVVGFTVKMVTAKDKDVAGKEVDVKDELEVALKVKAGLLEEGDVTLTIGGRAVANEVSSVITTITKVLSVNTEAAVLKVGLQGQKAGKITLTEAEKAMFKSSKDIVITIPTDNGITVDEPTVTVTAGDIQMDKIKVDTKSTTGSAIITIPVKRTSKTASTIEISGFEFTTNRTVAEGSFDIESGGTALTTTEETIELEDFIVIGTPNTEDITASNGLAKGTAEFKIGEATYTMNGETKEMKAASYIQDPGYTMVPVRYVAEAFGVAESDILFSAGTATIFAGNRTVQLTNGSNVAIVNGAAVTMETKVVVKDGRTYAPIGEVARILGISKEFDSTTKTAKFVNK